MSAIVPLKLGSIRPLRRSWTAFNAAPHHTINEVVMDNKDSSGQMWRISQTAMGFPAGHDRNRRFLSCGDKKVATFNYRMAEWHPDDDKALVDLCVFLNERDASE
jgi:hypothetical protein